jgi:hypothetical protein
MFSPLTLTFSIDETTGIQSSNELEGSSSANSPAVGNSSDIEHSNVKNTTVATHTASPALQQATRELHARIMSRVRDLAPSFTGAPSKPPPVAPPTTTATPKIITDTTPNIIQSTPSPTNTNVTSNVATKNTTRTVKELQHLISQYVQQQRANLGIANANTGATSPTNPNNNNANSNTNTRSTPNIPSVANSARSSTDISNQRGINNDNTFQKSSIIANKFSNAITKYARSPNALNSTATAGNTSTFANHPTTSGSHYSANGAKPFNQVMGSGHEGGPSVARSVASFTRPVTSILDKNVPALSIQYKHNQKEKRRKSEYGYYDDTSSNSSDGSTNYFLLAAQHELQNMDEEIAAMESIFSCFSHIETF